jgi:hypothetical protein
MGKRPVAPAKCRVILNHERPAQVIFSALSAITGESGDAAFREASCRRRAATDRWPWHERVLRAGSRAQARRHGSRPSVELEPLSQDVGIRSGARDEDMSVGTSSSAVKPRPCPGTANVEECRLHAGDERRRGSSPRSVHPGVVESGKASTSCYDAVLAGLVQRGGSRRIRHRVRPACDRARERERAQRTPFPGAEERSDRRRGGVAAAIAVKPGDDQASGPDASQ